jgi:hypothetical protein
MTMKNIVVGCVMATCGLVLGAAVMQDGGGDAAGGIDPAMAQAWAAYATPGEGQARLATREGKWNVVTRHWMTPDSPMEEASATSEFEMVFGGRFLGQQYKSNWAGMEFEGTSVYAHNNKSGLIQFTWFDNMGTGLMQGSGSFKGDVLHWTAMATDPLLGDVSMRGTETFGDPDHFVATMYYPGPDGKEFKMIELIYDRAGHSHADGDHAHAEHPGHDHPRGEHPHQDHPKGDHPK